MGSGNWFKAIIGRKKGKTRKSKQLKASERSNGTESNSFADKEDAAVILIQTEIRAFLARKSLHREKGIVRLQKLAQAESVKNQSTNTLSYLHSWGRIQTQIKERRLCMVVEGRLKQKKLENQLKLEAKLHDLEVEWCNRSDTMEEILARIHYREEAAVKRERALAYAFTHQWRVNGNQTEGVTSCELGKAKWGWSWKERWIAARPWENRAVSQAISTPKKAQSKQASKGNSINSLPSQKSLPIKPNGKPPIRARKLSFSGPESAMAEGQDLAV